MMDWLGNIPDNSDAEQEIVGFQTAHGSMYRYNSETQTVTRFKVSSSGTGQGSFQPESMCYFVNEKACDLLCHQYDYIKNHIFLGYLTEDKKIEWFDKNSVDLPEGASRVAYIVDPNNKKAPLTARVGATGPEIGLYPLDTAFYNPEKGFSPDKKRGVPFSHIGNKITKIYTDRNEFEADLEKAMSKFDATASSEQEITIA